MVEFQAVTGGGQGLPENEAGTLVGLGGLRGPCSPFHCKLGGGLQTVE